MAEKARSDISPQKRSLKLTPLIGDWTTYKPPRSLVKKVKLGLYGFDRLSAEELNLAHKLHYDFASKLCASLRTKLKTGTELYSVEGQQNSYANFLKNFSSPILQGKIVSPSFHDEIFVSLDLQVVDALINGALGSQDTSKLARELTEPEELILDTVLAEHIPSYYEIFKDVLANPAFEKVGIPEITQDMGINTQSTFVHFTVELSINGVLGKITFGYTGTLLKNMLKKYALAKKHGALALNKLPLSIFNLVELPVSVSIGKTSLTMSEIRSLEAGDVVSFDQNIDSAISISLSEGHVIYGQPGVKDGKFVVRVVAVEKEKHVKVAPPSYEKEAEEEPFKEEHALGDMQLNEALETPEEEVALEEDEVLDEVTEEGLDEGMEEGFGEENIGEEENLEEASEEATEEEGGQ